MRENIKLPSNRNFGLVFSVIFMLIALWPLINANEVRLWSIILSLIFLTLGMINSEILTPLNKLWHKLGIVLGGFFAPVVMGIIFFLVITPIGLLMRLMGKDILNLKKKNSKSYWILKKDSKNKMKNQF